MPVLEVEITLPAGEEIEAGLAAKLADAAGEVFGTPRGRTWVRLRTLPLERYAENGADGAPAGIRPVFVSVLLARLPDLPERKTMARKLAEATAAACGRPVENVHVLFQPEGVGRVAFGGEPPFR